MTAAAEEGANSGDGDGLTLLCLQRQVARILSMLALQPGAAQQLTEAAQKLPGGAAELLQGLYQYAEVSQHLHQAPGAVKASVPADVANSSSSRRCRQQRQAVAAAGAAAGAGAAAAAPTAAWLPWLLEAAASDDCLLSSYATKALLHLESAVAYSGSRRRLQQQQQQQQQQSMQQQQQGGSTAANSSSSGTWGQRLYQELRSSEEFAQLMEGIWPFSSSSSSSSSDGGQSWRPPVYYPDGIHLMHPTDSHNWGMLQPPPVSLIESLSVAAASAASAAAAVAASDLSQSEIDLGISAVPPAVDSPAASVAAAASAVANAAAAAAAAAAASALGAGPICSGADGPINSSSSSTAATDAAAGAAGGGDVGVLQPAVSWLAHKLVNFAAIKEEEVQQALQEAAGGSAPGSGNPAAPLGTLTALQVLVGRDAGGGAAVAEQSGHPRTRSGGAGPGEGFDQGDAHSQSQSHHHHQQQQQRRDDGVEEMIPSPAPPEVDIVFVHGIRGGPFVSWRKGTDTSAQDGAGASSSDSSAVAAAVVGGTVSSSSSSKKGAAKRQGVSLKPSTAAAVHSRHMTQEECWPAAWLAADVPNARLLTVEYKVSPVSI
jgi:hypothetical protein